MNHENTVEYRSDDCENIVEYRQMNRENRVKYWPEENLGIVRLKYRPDANLESTVEYRPYES